MDGDNTEVQPTSIHSGDTGRPTSHEQEPTPGARSGSRKAQRGSHLVKRERAISRAEWGKQQAVDNTSEGTELQSGAGQPGPGTAAPTRSPGVGSPRATIPPAGRLVTPPCADPLASFLLFPLAAPVVVSCPISYASCSVLLQLPLVRIPHRLHQSDRPLCFILRLPRVLPPSAVLDIDIMQNMTLEGRAQRVREITAYFQTLCMSMLPPQLNDYNLSAWVISRCRKHALTHFGSQMIHKKKNDSNFINKSWRVSRVCSSRVLTSIRQSSRPVPRTAIEN